MESCGGLLWAVSVHMLPIMHIAPFWCVDQNADPEQTQKDHYDLLVLPPLIQLPTENAMTQISLPVR